MNNNRKIIFEHFMDDMQRLSKSMIRDKHMQLNDLPYAQRGAMFVVAMHEKLSIKSLAAELQITSGAATQHVEALVQAGLAERHEDKNDRRIVHITLSRSGRKRFQTLKKQRVEAMQKMFKDVSDEDLDKFVSIMKKIGDTITKQETREEESKK